MPLCNQTWVEDVFLCGRLLNECAQVGETHYGHRLVLKYIFCFISFSLPQIIITLVLLYLQLGPSALVGSAVFVVLLPFQMKIASLMSKLQKQTLVKSCRHTANYNSNNNNNNNNNNDNNSFIWCMYQSIKMLKALVLLLPWLQPRQPSGAQCI